MTMSDPLGDMLARIKNGQRATKSVINCPASKLKASVLEVLKSEGYIRGYSVVDTENNKKELRIELKYDQGQPVIQMLDRVSKPGLRVYHGANDLPKTYNGLGVTVISTPKGVMPDYAARSQNVGGEVLCQVF
ncbi:MAG: 30S ribosomal protein S8 [Alphaproteobacteria bacterium]|jgi:small subunit ribosomal protein S8|nr:30S ribosomal protein S8 [Alphaproteobacteria bacterium]MDP7223573.1 30S ribosomal protein S8 [Alphaproteobacteria bacterium]